MMSRYRNLLLSFVQKRCLQLQPSAPSSPSLAVRFLTSEAAVSASQKKLRLREKAQQKHDSVVDFLKTHGFSDAQIAKLVAKRPAILRSHLEVLRPKFEYLAQNGFVGPFLAEVVSNCPEIWGKGLGGQIKPAIDMLKRHLATNEDVILAVRRSAKLLTSSNLKHAQQNIDLLIGERVPQAAISKMILTNPRILLHSPARVVNVLNAIQRLGLQPESPMFPSVFRVRISMSDATFQRKVAFLKSLGWSEADVVSTLKRCPTCLSCSEDKINVAMDFFVNTLKLEPRFIIGYPNILTFSIENRVRPRYELLKLLEARGIIELSNKFVFGLLQPEQLFLKKYVNKYLDQVPNLMELYGGSSTARA